MFKARMGAPKFAGIALTCALALVLIVVSSWRFAGADESAPSTATAPVSSPPAQAPTQTENASVKPDSVVSAAASPRDSVSKTQDGGAPQPKDSAPAERAENASTAPAEKPAEATVIPPGVAKQTESKRVEPGTAEPRSETPKEVLPKPGTKGVAVRGPKGPPRARVRTSSAKHHASDGAPAKAVASPASIHEGPTESDRVTGELERTERFVGRAQKSILLSKNTRAIKLFTSALDFQSDSREACKVRQYARAERLTLAARDFADRASRMVGPPREDPDYVEGVLRRTDDALDRAKDVLKTGADRDAWSQHDELKQEQKDAWKVFKDGDVGTAYKQTLGVREGVLALLRQLQDLPVPRETAEKAIGGAQAALEQANKELGPKPTLEALRFVRLANEYLTKARQSFSRGSYRSALLQAKVVERHVEHAVDVGRPRSG
jgi:hypothetical protein